MHSLVYLGPVASVSHVLPPNHSPNEGGVSLCGRSAWPGYWWGTGSYEEEQKAKTLPLCVRCKSILAHQSGRVGNSGR